MQGTFPVLQINIIIEIKFPLLLIASAFVIYTKKNVQAKYGDLAYALIILEPHSDDLCDKL